MKVNTLNQRTNCLNVTHIKWKSHNFGIILHWNFSLSFFFIFISGPRYWKKFPVSKVLFACRQRAESAKVLIFSTYYERRNLVWNHRQASAINQLNQCSLSISPKDIRNPFGWMFSFDQSYLRNLYLNNYLISF